MKTGGKLLLAFKNCCTIIFQQELTRNSEIKEKLENLNIEPIPLVIKQIPNELI